ncbi:MAG TPA: DUF5668 domain-containing protein [Ignavibacteriaceae bacterium]
MKTSNIFWGVFFITIGSLVLIGNLTDLNFTWNSAWKFWPTVLVLIGVSILVKNKVGKGIVAGLAALVLALTIYASVSATTNLIDNDFQFQFGDGSTDIDTTYFSQEFSDSIQTATLNFSGGAGGFKIFAPTEKLIDIRTEGDENNYLLNRNDNGTHSDLSFNMKSKHVKFGNSTYKNIVEMSLNSKPEWDLNFEVGAASLDLDLTPYKINKLDIDMGAAALNVKLGSLSDITRFNINAGASDMDILIPDSVGCEINSDASLSSRNYEGFKKITKNIYRTDNFDTSQKKIYIEIDCGVSSIDVRKY